MENNEFELSLFRTMCESDLSDLVLDTANEVCEQLPVFGTLKKLANGAITVRDHFYKKKVLKFLVEFSDMPAAERREQLEQLHASADEAAKFGEHVALLLERMNEIDKATLMGRTAKAYVGGQIRLDEMKSLNFAIDRLDTRLLPLLRTRPELSTKYRHESERIDDVESLVRCGLMTSRPDIETERIHIAAAVGESASYEDKKRVVGLRYRLGQLGELFIEVVCDETGRDE